ncbi:MarR family winged helix-turn-helix transcriptional regulator [Mangrovibrevibacter kandeliae]|uniref:MarR family winged helix-turn-helix transcriptional regulator n=1 Tax=Mangrovibrevibacter kandeliae TaxID=2968473 RepID=UPI002117464C|nr:MarR family transcriptional regulator [Aurantimonas sp. CSK15Z-1]
MQEAGSKKPPEECFARPFQRLVRMAVNADRDLARKHGLALADLCCLDLLETQDASAKEIAEYVDLSTGATTALIDRLEREGFVERRPNPNDRRGVSVHLVHARAKAALDEFRELKAPVKAAWLSLSAGEAAAVVRFLETAIGAADEAVETV